MIKRLLSLASFCVVFGLVVGRISHISSLTSIVAPPVAAQVGPGCGRIGNNSAVLAGSVQPSDVNESEGTLVLLVGEGDIGSIVNLINNSDKKVIVRLGAGITSENLTPEQYAGILNQIASQVNKPFIATAGHNEPNCAEWRADRGFEYEVNFHRTVASLVTDSKITLITGQIDHYCGDKHEGKTQTDYITALTAIPGIEGLALPYYITDGTPTAAATYEYFMQYAGLTSLPIYITESGPLKKDSFEEFARAVPLVVDKVEMMLLFNAFGYNHDGAFTYTRPFWNDACREAFRTQCQNPEEVIKICGQSTSSSYYLYQLPNFNPKAGADPDRAIGLFHDMVNQGYEVKCTTPRFSLAGKLSGDVADFEATHPPAVAPTFQINTEQSLNVSDAFIPLWRNEKSPLSGTQDPNTPTGSDPAIPTPGQAGTGSVFDSIERNFGHRDPTPAVSEEARRQKDIKSGVVYNLLSREAQCAQQVETLRYTKFLCDQLQDSEACALYAPIQNFPEYTTKTLLEAYDSSGLSCKKINTEPLSAAESRIASALDEVPLYLDRAYRLAFLVAVTEMKPDQSSKNIFFNFFAADNTGADQTKKHHVSVVAFKIPDIGTNREMLEDTDISYSDPLQLVRDALTPHDLIKQREEEYIQEIDRYRNVPFEGKKPRILCGGENCADPVVKALTDMINGSEDLQVDSSCTVDEDDLKAEDATIGDDGSLTVPTGTPTDPAASPAPGGTTTDDKAGAFFFQPGYDLIKSIFTRPEAQKTNPQVSEFNFLSNLNPNIRERSGGTDTVFYVVAPMGYNLEKLEETMVGRIFTEEGKAIFENNSEIAEYFRTEGFALDVNSEEKTYSFAGPTYAECLRVNFANPSVCVLNQIKVGVEPEPGDHAPRVMGGRLGYLIRRLQASITNFNDGANSYAKSCKTLDEFFRGECAGSRDAGTDGTDGGTTAAGGKCAPATSGPCSVDNLLSYFDGNRQKALIASTICNRESGGRASAENSSCTYGTDGKDNDGDGLVDEEDSWVRQERAGVVFHSFDGGTKDYSIGLFQINLLAHCPQAGVTFQDQPQPLACSFSNEAAMRACREDLLDPEGNIRAMLRISNNGTNWQPWGGAPNCGGS